MPSRVAMCTWLVGRRPPRTSARRVRVSPGDSLPASARSRTARALRTPHRLGWTTSATSSRVTSRRCRAASSGTRAAATVDSRSEACATSARGRSLTAQVSRHPGGTTLSGGAWWGRRRRAPAPCRMRPRGPPRCTAPGRPSSGRPHIASAVADAAHSPGRWRRYPRVRRRWTAWGSSGRCPRATMPGAGRQHSPSRTARASEDGETWTASSRARVVTPSRHRTWSRRCTVPGSGRGLPPSSCDMGPG